MLSNLFLKSFRILLFPLSLCYLLAIKVRNFLYDKKIYRSVKFALPVICIGNLVVGGTGKSPMVEYLLRLLKNHYRLATLSRGYRRKTKGYAIANAQSTALEIGDEPLQFYLKFPDVVVAVGEERVVAIPQIIFDKPDTQAIILDDAFQHRAVQAGLYILLTDYANLFVHDFYLPTGDLRDLKSRYKQADIIVATKCPANITESEKQKTEKEIAPLPHQKMFFATLAYGEAYHLLSNKTTAINEQTEVLLITGIANPAPLKKHIEQYAKSYTFMQFPDHHIFTIDDLKEIKAKYSEIQSENKLLLTTEKDAVRLIKFKNEIDQFYVIPVSHRFLFDGQMAFENSIIEYIEQNKPTG